MAAKGTISDKVGAEIIREYTTETPRPSAASLATRHGLQPRAVQRYLKRYLDTVTKATQAGVNAELAVAAYTPVVVAEVRQLTRDLPITSLCKVMEQSEKQYEKWKDRDPQLAGGYLDQMRKCAVEMAKWLGIDKGISMQDNSLHVIVDWGSEPTENVEQETKPPGLLREPPSKPGENVG